MFVFAFTLCCCVTACSWGCKLYRQQSTTETVEPDRRYSELRTLDSSSGGGGGGGGGGELGRAEAAHWDMVPTQRSSTTPRFAKCLYQCGRLCWAVTAAVVFIVLCLSLAFYPTTPTYSVCSNVFDWSSVLKGACVREVGREEGEKRDRSIERKGQDVWHNPPPSRIPPLTAYRRCIPGRIPIFLPSAPYNPTTLHTTLVVWLPVQQVL